ncbi:MAG: pyrrolo-quinoline quinone [Anaerolineae bacterium]|nr:MAG: pyrrolo-quinoline quinone [Anaerolineae bacterium]
MKKIKLIFPAKSIWQNVIAFILILILASLMGANGNDSAFAESNSLQPTKWTRDLPSDFCPNSQDTNCHSSSPLIIDLNNDQLLDIVVATNNGHVVAFNNDGALLWDTDVAPAFGMNAGKQEIHSSPSAADIDGDNKPEIVVGTGSLAANVCTKGGVIVLDHFGNVEDGWPRLSFDYNQDGCPDTIYSTPALGDLDRDGDMEIVAAGFDGRLYAWDHNGSLLPGFPPDSNHRIRFPTWGNLSGRLADSIWGSPTLTDLNNDGYMEIIIGTDEGNFDARWGGDARGWTCPYQLPAGWAPGYCGGSIYVFDRFGKVAPGFPYYLLEAVQSTPAVMDVDGDGRSEMFFGTGTFYYNNSPDHPTNGFKVYGKDGVGNDLPGWTTATQGGTVSGKVVGGATPASPAIGDIAGDTQPEIVMLSMDKKLYAWHLDGSLVNGFPMSPLDQFGKALGGFDVGSTLILANYDQDDKMEIFFNQAWVVNVVDGNGKQLTSTNYPYDKNPVYFTDGTLRNTPAVADIDNDGRLELIASNSKLYVWDLQANSDQAVWPMFKGNPNRTGEFPQPHLKVAPNDLVLFHQIGNEGSARTDIRIQNIGSGSFEWTAETPQEFSISQESGTVTSSESDKTTVIISTDGREEGEYILGNITINATMEVGAVKNAQESISVRLIVGDFYRTFTPLIGN